MELHFPIGLMEGCQKTDLEALSPGLHRLQQANLSELPGNGNKPSGPKQRPGGG